MGDAGAVKSILLQSDLDIIWTNKCGLTCLMLASTIGMAGPGRGYRVAAADNQGCQVADLLA
jgi:hypothetical protein